MSRYRLEREQAEEQAEALADRLQSLLGPIDARPEFVQGLKTRLVTKPAIAVEHRGQATALVIVGAGLFAGALLVWFLFRLRSLMAGR